MPDIIDAHYIAAAELARLRAAERERDRLRRIANVQQMLLGTLVVVSCLLLAALACGAVEAVATYIYGGG